MPLYMRQAMSPGPDPPAKRRWNFVDWATVVSLVLAVMGFLGYGTWQAFIPSPPSPRPAPPPTAPGPRATVPSPSQPVTNGTGQPAYRPPSDLSGEAWAGTIDGREVTLRFGGTNYAGDVSVSDPGFGREGRWHARGRLNVDIELAGPQRTIIGTMGPDGETMAVTVNVLGSKDLQYATLRRVR
jgi:hypothetical protein